MKNHSLLKRSFLFLGLSVVFLISSCKQKSSYSYKFEHKLNVFPVQNSYEIGDTIYLEFDMDDDMEALVWDEKKNEGFYKKLQLSNFNFDYACMNFYKLNQVSNEVYNKVPALNSFDKVIQNGVSGESDDSQIMFNYEHTGGKFRFKMRLICLESGVFYINPSYYSYHSRVNSPEDLNLLTEVDYDYLGEVNYTVNKNSDGTFNNNFNLFSFSANSFIYLPQKCAESSFYLKVN